MSQHSLESLCSWATAKQGNTNMNTAVQSQRVADVHIRELHQILAHGQSQSRTALVDIASGNAWVLGRGNTKYAPLDQQLIATFGGLIFSPQRVGAARRDRAREMVTKMGGISMVAILMSDCDLFLAKLPSSSRVISLVVSHHNAGTVVSDSVLRGRAIRAKLDPASKSNNALIQALTAPFSKSSSSEAASPGVLASVLGTDDQVLAGDLFDLAKGVHLNKYRAPHSRALNMDVPATLAALKELFGGNMDLHSLITPMGFAGAEFGKVQMQIGELDFYWLRIPYFPALQLPFDPDRVLLLYKEPRPYPALDWVALDHVGLNLLRMRIGALLESGMQTSTEPFPETQVEFQAIMDELGALDPGDLINRLDIGGFVSRPVEISGVMQRCQECIYFLSNRQWCDLPELPVPVKPEWWCRLWKV
jgi:hypothetical protein